MATINLLPWREQKRARKNKAFLMTLLISLAAGLMVALITWNYFNKTLHNQYAANDIIIAENESLDKELTDIETLSLRREEMMSHIRVIQGLQVKRPIPVQIWDDVAKAIPDALYLNSMKKEQGIITFIGKAQNPNVVSMLVRRLDASDWLEDAKVNFIKQDITAYDTAVLNSESKADYRVNTEERYIDFVVTTQVIELTTYKLRNIPSDYINKELPQASNVTDAN